jgi:hypothetical protein
MSEACTVRGRGEKCAQREGNKPLAGPNRKWHTNIKTGFINEV